MNEMNEMNEMNTEIIENSESAEKELGDLSKYDRILAVALNDDGEDMAVFARAGKKGVDGFVELLDIISGVAKSLKTGCSCEDECESCDD